LPKPPVVSGKATVAVLPHSGSPAVVPLHVVVSAAVVAVQVICSPFGFAVVGMNRNGIPPTVAFTGPVAVMAHVLELVFVQDPAAAPTAVQVPPIVVVHPTPGVPETPGAVGTPGVRVDVGVVSVPVGVEVAVANVPVAVGVAVANVPVEVGVAVLVPVGVAVSVAVAWLSTRPNAKWGLALPSVDEASPAWTASATGASAAPGALAATPWGLDPVVAATPVAAGRPTSSASATRIAPPRRVSDNLRIVKSPPLLLGACPLPRLFPSRQVLPV